MYDEIYNFRNKWNKDYGYYRAFDMDESTVAQTDYLKAKHRRTLYANKFSRKTTLEVQHLVREQVRFNIRITHPDCLMDFSWIYSVMRSRSRMQPVRVFLHSNVVN